MKYILILAFFFLLGQAYAQQKTIYVLNNRYNEHVNEFINKSPTFKPYRILVNYQIVDADDSRLIDYARVEGWVKKYFPHKNDEGVLCIDLENELYQHLKTKHPNSREYKR